METNLVTGRKEEISSMISYGKKENEF